MEVVAPLHGRRTAVHHARALAAGATTLALCLCAAAFSAASSSSPERSFADKLLEVRASSTRQQSLALGHFVENGRVHYFQQTAPPASAYFNPAADTTEYRAASTSGLGFAGGGDPYKYIRTGHYSKILAAEHDVEQGWSNGTTYHSLGAMTAVHGRMQELASASALGTEIKSRDEAILALLSAPVSSAQLREALPALRPSAKGGRENSKAAAAGLRNLNKYIKQSIDSFSAPEREKLQSLSEQQLLQLKTNLITSAAARASKEALMEEEGHNVFAEDPKSKPPTVAQEIRAEKQRALALERITQPHAHYGKEPHLKAKNPAPKPSVPKAAPSSTVMPVRSHAMAFKTAASRHPAVVKSAPSKPADTVTKAISASAKAAALQRFSDAYFGHSQSVAKRKQARAATVSSDVAARSWTPPAKMRMAGLASKATQSLAQKGKGVPATAEAKWEAKERELGIATAHLKKASKGGFQKIESTRKRKSAAKKLAEEDEAQSAKAATVVEKMLQGDQMSRAVKGLDPLANSVWDAKEAKKLSKMSVFTATRQTATKATEGYRNTPAMSDPYRYIRTGNYAKILAQEALKDKTFTPTQ